MGEADNGEAERDGEAKEGGIMDEGSSEYDTVVGRVG